MTHSQTDKRFLKALAGDPVDRPPYWFMRQAGRYLPEYQEVRKQAGDFLNLCYSPDLACEVTLQPIRRYSTDAAILFSDILVVPDALGQKVEYIEGTGPVLNKLEQASDLDKLDVSRLHDHLTPVYETIGKLSKELPDDVALIGFAGSPWTVASYMVQGSGSKEFELPRLWALKEPKSFARLIDILVEATGEYLVAQIRAGAEAVQLFDSWSGVLPPTAFRELCVEPTKRIVSHIKASYPDTPVIGFPRGAGAKYRSYFETTGVDAVSLDTSVSPAWAAQTLQGIGAVQGNLDPLSLVAGGAALVREAATILETLSSGPFVFNLGHGIVPQTPPENVAALAELIRNWND